MKETPLVSVFLPTYNQEDFIAESIESVIGQDYENIEIIIGDDCSVDNTWQIVQEFQKQYPNKIKSFKNNNNLGITGNCNEILKRCTGKYVVFTAGDDLFLPGKLSKQVSIMERDENVVLCYHDVEVFLSENNETISYWNRGQKSRKAIYGNAGVVANAVVETGNGFMAGMSVMVKRDAIPKSGYDYRIPLGSDWLMWIEVLANATDGMMVEYIPDVFARYRRHNFNVTNSGYSDIDDLHVTLAITENRYPFLIKSVDKCKALLRYSKGVRLIISGDRKMGRRMLLESLRTGWVSWQISYWVVASFISKLVLVRKLNRSQ